jgi:hypothetical protein
MILFIKLFYMLAKFQVLRLYYMLLHIIKVLREEERWIWLKFG